jgi:hypothetical protein
MGVTFITCDVCKENHHEGCFQHCEKDHYICNWCIEKEYKEKPKCDEEEGWIIDCICCKKIHKSQIIDKLLEIVNKRRTRNKLTIEHIKEMIKNK